MSRYKVKQIEWGPNKGLNGAEKYYVKLPMGHHAKITRHVTPEWNGWRWSIHLRMTTLIEGFSDFLEGAQEDCQTAWETLLIEAFEEVEDED